MPIAPTLPANPRPSAWQQVGTQISQGLGRGLEAGMNMSLQQKMSALDDQRKVNLQNQQNMQHGKALAKMLGIPELGEHLGQLDPQSQKLAIENLSQAAYNDAITGGGGGGKQASQYNQGPTQKLQALQQQGTGLPQYDMAVGQGQQPQMTQPAQFPKTQQAQAVQQMSPAEEGEQPSIAGKVGGIGIPKGIRAKDVPRYLAAKRAEETLDLQREKVSQRKEEFEYKKEREKNEPARVALAEEVKKINASRGGIRKKEYALKLSNDALKSGNIGAFSTSSLSELLGFEPGISPDAAAYKVAQKEFFLSNLTRAGNRPNQWIEQQIQGMMGKLGRTEAANLTANEALRGDLAVDKEEARLMDELIEKYPDDPARVIKEKNERLDKFAVDEQKRVKYNLQDIVDKEDEEKNPLDFKNLKKVRQGTPLTKRKKDVVLDRTGGNIEEAMELAVYLGYDIYK